MPQRLIGLEFLPTEFVAALDRKVGAALRAVDGDATQTVAIRILVNVRFDAAQGDVIATHRTSSVTGDAQEVELGRIRDRQLVLPGTGVRHEEDPCEPPEDSLEDPIEGLVRFETSQAPRAMSGRR